MSELESVPSSPVEGYAFESLSLGQTFRRQYRVTPVVSYHFVAGFQDTHPLHMDDGFAKTRGFKSKVVHGAILHGFLSHFVGCGLAVPEVMLLSTELNYASPCYSDDTLELVVQVSSLSAAVRVAEMKVEFVRVLDSKRVAFGRIRVRWGS